MRVGVTGGHGFIGSRMVKRLDNPLIFGGDIRVLSDVLPFVRECDVIYHFAGKNREEAGKIIANNLVGTANLVLATKILKVSPQIIFASSTQAQTATDTEYGMVKRIEEKIVRQADRWCIFRIPNVYGEGGKPFYNSVVATFAYQIAHEQSVTISNSDAIREFIFVDKLVGDLMKPQNHEVVSPIGEVLSIGTVYEFMTSKLGIHANLKKCVDYYKKEVK